MSRRQQLFVLVGLVALSLNLRPAAVSVGPLLDEIRHALSMSATVAGVQTTLPVLAFACFGALAPGLARAVGVHKVMLAALLFTAGCLWLRAETGSVAVFLAASVGALAGMAAANVLLPSLVKRHFPDRVGLVTGIYTTALAIGLTGGSVLTVPIAEATGGWRSGLAAWAVVAAVAAAPWVGLLRHDVRPVETVHASIPTASVGRSSLGRWMALLFGLQSLQAYAVFGWLAQIFRDAGFSADTAGLLLGVTTGISIPVSFLAPGLVARLTDQTWLMLGFMATYVVGYGGLLLWPTTLPYLWALMIGLGCGIFPVVLTLIGLRARTPDGTAALSGFSQSVGYLISAVGPFLMGALYGWTGGWTVPLLMLLAMLVPLTVAALKVSRPRYVEDELPVHRPPLPTAT